MIKLPTMSTNSFSRSYLLGVPNEYRKTEFNQMVSLFIQDLLKSASESKTSYFYDMTKMTLIEPNPPSSLALKTRRLGQSYTIPMDELLPMFQEKFPDCKVTYEEGWMNSTPTQKVLRKGIMIDWSCIKIRSIRWLLLCLEIYGHSNDIKE